MRFLEIQKAASLAIPTSHKRVYHLINALTIRLTGGSYDHNPSHRWTVSDYGGSYLGILPTTDPTPQPEGIVYTGNLWAYATPTANSYQYLNEATGELRSIPYMRKERNPSAAEGETAYSTLVRFEGDNLVFYQINEVAKYVRYTDPITKQPAVSLEWEETSRTAYATLYDPQVDIFAVGANPNQAWTGKDVVVVAWVNGHPNTDAYPHTV